MATLFYLILTLLLPFTTSSPSQSQALLQIQRPIIQEGEDSQFCDSWRLSVETNNAGLWTRVPSRCVGFVAGYMNGVWFASDLEVVVFEAMEFARRVPVVGDGKDIWVFDIDETLLSNLPYYSSHEYGSEAFNETSFNAWVDLAKAPALPASLKLYNELLGLGFQAVLLTGRDENQRSVTEENLLLAGYSSWDRLFLRGPSDQGTSAVVYKSGKRAELVAQGYRIHGSCGDQWSDLIGSPMATRSFKIPNPLYYIS